LELSAGGLRDASRLADSSYRVWRDICLTNTENLEQALTTLVQTLEHMRDSLRSRDLEHLFDQSNDLRRRLKTPEPTR
jgi:prephenate dehydrogenase